MLSFLIITHVPHIQVGNQFYGYAPYVREMNIWLKYFDKVIIVAPKSESQITKIEESYNHKNIEFIQLDSFNILNFRSIVKSIISIPKNLIIISKAIKKSDHIHLRCPGNMGLLGAILQIFFPKKIKTAKYAGNWDPKAKQPWTYKLQRWILSNTLLTKNMQVLVYGEWPNQTKNIKSFFTATYSEKERLEGYSDEKFNELIQKEIKFLFVGTLTLGKRPLYAIQMVEKLLKLGYTISLEIYGDGILKEQLFLYVKEHNLENTIFIKGNQSKENLKEAYLKAHFLILPSESEGWPKVVAEAMFWGTIPLASRVSCVSNMLNNNERGILLNWNLEEDIQHITDLIKNEKLLKMTSQKAQLWSQDYTVEQFQLEINNLLMS
ncbi:glycosyltransferase [Flavobacterium oreochromis]|uniref:glycosyltransferase n=1 Tax=Flavobacterium oreochromis TaxID=2906078 RepID=UPI000CDB4D51|nr:glycosyl transferase [Flavobacterium columnare]